MGKHKESRILAELHETAQGLQALGFIDKRRMSQYDALCLEAIQEFSPEKVKSIRASTNMSQVAFASVLNTSPSTVRKWEAGDKRPSGPSAKLLDLIERKGLEVLL